MSARHDVDREPLIFRASDASSSRCECLCGSLLARWVPGGVELKCRRCRRVVVIECAPPESAPES